MATDGLPPPAPEEANFTSLVSFRNAVPQRRKKEDSRLFELTGWRSILDRIK